MNLFPSVLIAGAPHTGKSVLSYLLTQHLRRMGVLHYLLRVAPDGEGDWFFQGPPANVRLLRASKKRPFTETFTQKMLDVIHTRHLPLLVDAGGRPRGAQFGILNACTHAILLYHDEAERSQWHAWLVAHNIHIIAELQSKAEGEDALNSSRPLITGTITGLERDASRRRVGLVFGALLETLAGIFAYDALELRQEHLRLAPLEPLEEKHLAFLLENREVAHYHWKPEALAALERRFPSQESYALYGRGPVWLAAFVAAHASPAPLALFDARYGWLPLPRLCFDPPYTLHVEPRPGERGALWLEISLPEGLLEPDAISFRPPQVHRGAGVILSGPLPRWAFAALTVHFLPLARWVAVYDPALDASVVVGSRSSAMAVGDLLPGGQRPASGA